MSDKTPAPVEIPTPFMQHQSEPNGIVHVNKLYVPPSMIATIIAVLIGGVASMAAVWWRTTSHAEAREVHVDSREREKGAGVAYKNDVSQLRQDIDKRLADDGRKTRRLIKSMTMSCRKRGENLACSIDLPEDIE